MKQRRNYSLLSMSFLMLNLVLCNTIYSRMTEINNTSHFNQMMAQNKPMVVYFYADWCSVCKRAKPKIEQISNQYSNIGFLQVNEANNRELINQYGVNAYPTFIFFDANGMEVERLKGINEDKLHINIKMIQQKPKMPKPEPIKKMEPAEPLRKIENERLAQKMKPVPTPMKEPAELLRKIEKKMPTKVKPVEKPKPMPTPVEKPKLTPMEKPAPAGEVIELQSSQHFDELRAKKKPIVLDIYTTWCGPCKTMKPIFKQLAQENSEAIFIAIDAEKIAGVCSQYGIKGYPTFIFLDGMGNEVDRISGSNSKMLMQNKISKATGKKSSTMILEEYTETVGGPARPATKSMAAEQPMMEKNSMRRRAKRYRR
ncbi:MAG: thioredoxin domain-containing protein [Candidatus Babeliales bacterium]